MRLLERHACQLLAECARDFRVTIVTGARQAGKTTLLSQFHRQLAAPSSRWTTPTSGRRRATSEPAGV